LLTYSLVLNTIKIGLVQKRKNICIKKTKKATQIVLLCFKLNMLVGYTELIKNNFVYYNLYYNINFNKIPIILMSATKKHMLKSKFIYLLFNKKPYSQIYFNTNKGIISLKDAFHLNIGGILFCMFI